MSAARRPGGGAFTLAAVGDVVLARDDPADAFAHVLGELAAADLASCNVEVPLSDEGMPQHGKFETLHSAPGMIAGYVAAGFGVASLANNHAMDYGPVALVDTMRRLDEHGITHAGAGLNRAEAWTHRTREVNGAGVAFTSFASEAFLGFGATATRPGIAMVRRDPLYGPDCVNPEDVASVRATIARASEDAGCVVASFHWGLSQSDSLSASQRSLARAAVEAGADLVIGHHPHVVQGIELLAGVPVLYSLGNFVFDLAPYFFSPGTRDSVLVRVRFEGGAATGVEVVPVRLDGEGRPRPAAAGSEDAARILGRVLRLSADLGTELGVDGPVARVRLPAARA